MSIIIFFIILLVLVLVHEAGHFFAAKYFGIRVDEFGFGFPPKIFGWKKGETEYSLNLLPIGGFVKIFGENPDPENVSGPDATRSFVNKPKWQQAIVLVAGVFSNFLLAWVLFSVGYMSGLPTRVGDTIAGHTLADVNVTIISVAENSPAKNAGLKSGDKILALTSGADTAGEITIESVKSFILSHGDKAIDIKYSRGLTGATAYTTLTPKRALESSDPVIGISMDTIGVAKLPFFSAIIEGMKVTTRVTKETTVGLYMLIKNALIGQGSLDGVTGPVGLVGIVGDASSFGFYYLLSFTAMISINLGVINLIPFPALDGGRLFFLLIEKIKGSAINQKFFNYANLIGFGLLILFMLIVTYRDIINLM